MYKVYINSKLMCTLHKPVVPVFSSSSRHRTPSPRQIWGSQVCQGAQLIRESQQKGKPTVLPYTSLNQAQSQINSSGNSERSDRIDFSNSKTVVPSQQQTSCLHSQLTCIRNIYAEGTQHCSRAHMGLQVAEYLTGGARHILDLV